MELHNLFYGASYDLWSSIDRIIKLQYLSWSSMIEEHMEPFT